MIYAVSGNNYGDEGKGLAVDYLTLNGHNLVVRHNGGSQAAHTVDREDKRFVFHEISSGSFNDSDTYWSGTFLPDLYKLEEEIEGFAKVSGKQVKIFASTDANTTLLYDVYLNQKKEELRGSDKHGSCGMGIWEATRRSGKGFGLTLGDISSMTVSGIASKLEEIEKEYFIPRLATEGIEDTLELDTLRYAELLKNVLTKYVALIKDEAAFIRSYDNVIFEGGQGLLLDTERKDLWPHTTCSRTNIANPVNILNACGLKLDEAIYVTRSYLTRHGAGPFAEDPDLNFIDETNIPNPWQDNMRFGRHGKLSSLVGRASDDSSAYGVKASLFVTHLNETGDKILTEDGDESLSDLSQAALDAGIGRLYLSRSRFSKDVSVTDL